MKKKNDVQCCHTEICVCVCLNVQYPPVLLLSLPCKKHFILHPPPSSNRLCFFIFFTLSLNFFIRASLTQKRASPYKSGQTTFPNKMPHLSLKHPLFFFFFLSHTRTQSLKLVGVLSDKSYPASSSLAQTTDHCPV